MEDLIKKLHKMYIDAEEEYQKKLNKDYWKEAYKMKADGYDDAVDWYTYDLYFIDGKRHMAFEAYKAACESAGIKPYTLDFD